MLVNSAFGGVGGIETFNRALIHALDELALPLRWRVDVHSLLDAERVPEADPYLSSGLTQVRGFAGNRLRFVSSAFRAHRFADIVIIGHVNLLLLAPLMKGSVKYLVAHGIEVWKELTVLQKLGAARVDSILCVSAYTKGEMMRLNGMTEDRFCLFPNTLDPLYNGRQTKADRRALGLPDGVMLLSVSRLLPSERYKNIRAAITSLPAVLEKVPEAFFVVVGEGEDRKALRELADSSGLSSKVIFPGAVPDEVLPSYYEACDIFLLPSVGEGFGVVFLEAMYHGKPCIGAKACGIPEVVQDGVTGLLVDPSDLPSSLPQAMLRLLTNQGLRKCMGERGQEEFERNFSFVHFRERLRQILCEASASRLNRGDSGSNPILTQILPAVHSKSQLGRARAAHTHHA